MHDIPQLEPMSSPRSWHQLGILLLDGSGSMKREGPGGRPLAADVGQAVKDFLGYFKGSSQVNNFSIGVVTFDDIAIEHTPPTELGHIDDYADYNPLTNHGGKTNIGAALAKAEQMALAHLGSPEARNGVPHTAHIIILTDGLCLSPDSTRQVAARVRAHNGVDLFGSLFSPRNLSATEETEMAKGLMRDVVGDDSRYKTTHDEASIREFFKKSMSANALMKRPASEF